MMHTCWNAALFRDQEDQGYERRSKTAARSRMGLASHQPGKASLDAFPSLVLQEVALFLPMRTAIRRKIPVQPKITARPNLRLMTSCETGPSPLLQDPSTVSSGCPYRPERGRGVPSSRGIGKLGSALLFDELRVVRRLSSRVFHR